MLKSQSRNACLRRLDLDRAPEAVLLRHEWAIGHRRELQRQGGAVSLKTALELNRAERAPVGLLGADPGSGGLGQGPAHFSPLKPPALNGPGDIETRAGQALRGRWGGHACGEAQDRASMAQGTEPGLPGEWPRRRSVESGDQGSSPPLQSSDRPITREAHTSCPR